MNIRINGRDERRPEALTLEDLVAEKRLAPEQIVIEYNREIVPRERWPKLVLKEGDAVEIVSFVGGG